MCKFDGVPLLAPHHLETSSKFPLRWNIAPLWPIIERHLLILHIPEVIKEKQLDRSYIILFNDQQNSNMLDILSRIFTVYYVDI